MDDPPTVDQMNEFYDKFGTHTIRELSMGARFVASSTYNKQDMANMKQAGYDLKFEAKASYFGYSASGSSSHSSD